MGEHTAVLLKLVPKLAGRYDRTGPAWAPSSTPPGPPGNSWPPIFARAPGTRWSIWCVWTPSARCWASTKLGEGSANAADITSRKVVETALAQNATTAILAHNHISGLALPSQADLTTTRRLRAVLREVGVELSDHLIFADDDMVSLRDSGLFEWYGAEPPDF